MLLPDLNLPSFLDTSSADLIGDFFIPALTNSVRYDRGVGFFSSGWLRIAATGMAQFAERGGFARWVTSPILSKTDWEAMQTGDDARTNPVLRAALEQNIQDLIKTLEKDTLSALAWLVADGILNFKIALPRNKLERGDFHDKFGIFTDGEGNRISFNGSYNDSIQGTRNYESIKIFISWDSAFAPLVQSDAERFEQLWENEDPNVRVFDLPEANREQIIRLRSNQRPYVAPEQGFLEPIAHQKPPQPEVPSGIELRNYQIEAIDAWFDNKRRGVFEMATGTGKTITALAAAVSLYNQKNRLAIIITCPYKHLVEQWASEAVNFGFRPIKVAESKKRWAPEVSRVIRGFRRTHNDLVTIITTNSSLRSGLLPEILKDIWPEALFIADEAHHLGAPKMLQALPKQAPWRLGLSATPVRHYDAEGTDAILDFFEEVVFSFRLDEAIGTYLTPYYYHPIPVEMTEDEFDEFCALTKKLGKFSRDPDEPMSEAAKKIAINRAWVLNNSVANLEWIQYYIQEYSKMEHTLFYTGDKLFDQLKELLGVEKRIKIHEFTQRQNNRERKDILKQFAVGELQALVAMKCLDEGVDVPPTRVAYFLASSGNPREFVQRRGRVLRRFPGKEYATLYDLISIPPAKFLEVTKQDPEYNAVRAAVRREYRRIKEFAELAENHYQALDAMFDVADKLGLIDA